MAEAGTHTDLLKAIFYKDVKLCKDATQGFLGKGSFGKVHRCCIPEHGEAAIKLFELEGSDEDFKNLEDEIFREENKLRSMQAVKYVKEDDIHKETNLLRKMQTSERVINIYGCTRYMCNIGIITEYVPYGDLHSLMKQKKAFVPLTIRLRILYDTATGLDHLHRATFDHRVTHNDLKPNNILLDENCHAKICDLGGANIATYSSTAVKIAEPNHSTVHTVPYAAPEFLKGSRDLMIKNTGHPLWRTRGMDIYSFGMTSYFVLTTRDPFGNWDKASMKNAIIAGVRPELNVENIIKSVNESDDKLYVIESLVGMVTQCWHQNPKERPENAGKIKEQLMNHLLFFDGIDVAVKILKEKYPIKKT